MAVNAKTPITVAPQNRGTSYSLHHDLAGHFRMDRAVVGIRSCLGKGVRELFVRVHYLGLEFAVRAHRRMRNVIAVCPCVFGRPRMGWLSVTPPLPGFLS
jgi:hypothetical protein